MERSEAYVRWHTQATEAQDPNRPNMEEDLNKAVEELGRSQEPEQGRTRSGDDGDTPTEGASS